MLRQTVLGCEEQDRWDGWRLDNLQAYLEHVVEGAELDEAEHGPAHEWQLRVEHLRRNHETDDRGLLDKLRPYWAKIAEDRARINEAERRLLEAARAEKVQLLGTPVPRGAKPDGAVDPVPIPVTYLLKPVAVSLSHNRLTCDWDADVGAIRGWTKDYADLRVKTKEVTLLCPHGGATDGRVSSADAFDQPYWNLLQILAWVCLRNRGMVCKAANDAIAPVTTLRFDIMAAMHAASRGVVFYDREEAERAIRYAAQDEKLTVTGLRNGRGDRTYIPRLAWADLVFKFPLDSPTYATPWNDGSDALQWHALMFRRSEVLALWPAVPIVPTITFLDLARAIAADERIVADNMRRLRSDAVLGEFPSGTLGWNAREHLQQFDPEEPDEIVKFDPVTPIRIVHQLAEFGDAVAEAVLNLSEGEACRRIAEASLPPNGSRARVFIGSLAITKSEARRYCRRYGMPVPDRLRESPIAWSDTVHMDAITVGELPSMAIAEIARRWSRELGENGLGDGSIWRTIWRAFWQGTLARNEGLIVPLDRPNTKSNIERFTRAKLLWAIARLADLPFTLQRRPESDAEGRVTEATEDDYDKVTDQWDEVVRRMGPGGWRDAYIDTAMLEREPFLVWCKEERRDPPTFWIKRSTEKCDAPESVVGHWLAQDRLELKIVINIARGTLPTDWPPREEWLARFRTLKAVVDAGELSATLRGLSANKSAVVRLTDLRAFVASHPGAEWNWLSEFYQRWVAARHEDMAVVSEMPIQDAAATTYQRAWGAYSESKLRGWYEKWIAECSAAGKTPSRDEDWAAAKAELGDGVPRDAIRRLRRELAPDDWKRFGRRRTGGRESGDD